MKKVKHELEEKDNDIHSLSYDKDGLRQELKDLNHQMDTLKGTSLYANTVLVTKGHFIFV